jgi:hypothetical protein
VDEDKEAMVARRQGITKAMQVKVQQILCASSAHTQDRDIYNTRQVYT